MPVFHCPSQNGRRRSSGAAYAPHRDAGSSGGLSSGSDRWPRPGSGCRPDPRSTHARGAGRACRRRFCSPLLAHCDTRPSSATLLLIVATGGEVGRPAASGAWTDPRLVPSGPWRAPASTTAAAPVWNLIARHTMGGGDFQLARAGRFTSAVQRLPATIRETCAGVTPNRAAITF